jgi:hypothetical protein
MDPKAVRLLEMFDKANERIERSPYKYEEVEISNSQIPKVGGRLRIIGLSWAFPPGDPG